MSRTDKLLAKARRNPASLAFSEFETLLARVGWQLDHTSGSHRIFYSPNHYRLSIQPSKNGKAKAYQVRQFLTEYDHEHP
jgi:predicted RNA binding protein YcfA (HicA-like mRNA interferase family)